MSQIVEEDIATLIDDLETLSKLHRTATLDKVYNNGIADGLKIAIVALLNILNKKQEESEAEK